MINKFKKLLLAAALLLPLGFVSPAHAATEVDIKVEWCDLLETIGFQVGFCRAELTVGTPTSPTDTSVSISVTTDRAGSGTLYAYPTTSCVTAPSEATMKASTRTYPVVSSTIATTITNLTPSTTGYCVWFAQEWERRMSEVVKSDSFNTSSGGTPGTTPPGIYVKNGDGCSDTNDGSDDANAVCTLAKAETLHDTTGEDVYLKVGSRWVEQFIFGVGGNATNYASLSCYEMVEGVEQRCDAETYYGTSGANSTLPKVAGPNTEACLAALNCPFNVFETIPGVFSGQVQIDEKNYVEIYGVQVEYTRGVGFLLTGPSTTSKSMHHIELQWLRAYKVARQDFLFQTGIGNLYGYQLVADGGSMCSSMTRQPGAPEPNLPNCKKTGGWNGSIVFVRSMDSDSLIENYEVIQHYGESSNCGKSSGVVFRNGRVSNNLSFLYSDASSECIFENILALGTQGEIGYYPTTSNFGGGPGINIEFQATSWGQDGNDNIYRNIIALDTGDGFQMNMPSASRASGLTVGGGLYHSVIVSPVGAAFTSNTPDANTDTLEASNNIFWNEDSTNGTCSVTTTKSVFTNNMWWGKTPVAKCQGTGYMFADPQLNQNVYSVYDTYNYSTFPNPNIVQLRPSSPAKNAGNLSTVTKVCIDKTKFVYAISKMQSPAVDADIWATCGGYDFYGNVRSTTTAPHLGPFKDSL